MRIDIAPCKTKGREIVDFSFEYLELADSHFIYAGKMETEEWDEDDDDTTDIDKYIQACKKKIK